MASNPPTAPLNLAALREAAEVEDARHGAVWWTPRTVYGPDPPGRYQVCRVCRKRYPCPSATLARLAHAACDELEAGRVFAQEITDIWVGITNEKPDAYFLRLGKALLDAGLLPEVAALATRSAGVREGE